MGIIGRVFSTSLSVTDGQVECPLNGCVPVTRCAGCPWLTALKIRGADEEMAVSCRPRAASLADLPPV